MDGRRSLDPGTTPAESPFLASTTLALPSLPCTSPTPSPPQKHLPTPPYCARPLSSPSSCTSALESPPRPPLHPRRRGASPSAAAAAASASATTRGRQTGPQNFLYAAFCHPPTTTTAPDSRLLHRCRPQLLMTIRLTRALLLQHRSRRNTTLRTKTVGPLSPWVSLSTSSSPLPPPHHHHPITTRAVRAPRRRPRLVQHHVACR